MFHQLLCKPHSEPVRYVGLDSNNQIIGFCTVCAPNAEGKLQLIEDFENSMEQIKHFLQGIVEQQKLENRQILTNLHYCLTEFKNQQTQQINILLHSLETEILNQTKSQECIQEQIRSFTSLQQTSLISFFENLIVDSDDYNIKTELQRALQNLENSNVVMNCSKVLSQFPSKKYHQHNYSIFDKLQYQKTVKCKIHGLDIVAIDQFCNIYPDKLKCLQCLAEKPCQVKLIQDVNKSWNEYHQNMASIYLEFQNYVNKSEQTIYYNIYEQIEQKKEKLQKSLSKLEIIVNKKLKFLEHQIKQNRVFQEVDYSSRADLAEVSFTLKNQSQIYDTFNENFKRLDTFRSTQSIIENDYQLELQILFQCLSELETQINNYNKDIYQVRNLYSIDYQILDKSTLKQKEPCYAIAINSQGNTLAAGCFNKIQIFNFNFGQLKPLQILDDHQDFVNCLKFMKDKNKLVSAGNDKTIKIWTQQFNCWSLTQTLQGHLDLIFCLLISQKGDFIISGGLDKSIQFWNCNDNNDWFVSQIISEHQKDVNDLSLNQTESKLISCGNDNLILVMERKIGKWQIIQKINTLYGFRLCFITDNLFTFQPKSSEELQIFKYDSQHQQFFRVNEIQMKHNKRIKADNFLFPSRFINQKQVFVNKFKNNIHIIRKFGEEELKIENCIEFKDQFNFGTLSDDGEYLVIWSYETKEIQVRLYKEIFVK